MHRAAKTLIHDDVDDNPQSTGDVRSKLSPAVNDDAQNLPENEIEALSSSLSRSHSFYFLILFLSLRFFFLLELFDLSSFFFLFIQN
ncbi:hypothetical protein BVRB_6g146810 [Beta vulgaris subsp. vulgaris]|nr:hypothetical protein BVRB_6g146810 [Beta vulgaris subsp. vulgaris]